MSAEEIGIYFGIAAALVAGAWVLYRHLSEKPGKAAEVDVVAIVATLQEGHRNQLHDAAQREGTLRDQVGQLTEAVQALSNERDKPDAPAGIDEALELLAKGETGAAEAIFQSVKERRKAEEAEAFTEAAAAARHIGALAFLHDTGKALAAYREAVELDPDNADGWNQLGHLLHRTGDLDDAEKAFRRVLALGSRSDDLEMLAIATGNLGLIYKTRGMLDHAEEMYKKSLAHSEALGRKSGIATQYGNLGLIYMDRGEFDRAEEMYNKSLALNEAIGRKEGMAVQYGNLGSLFSKRGELDRAETMYLKGLQIDLALGHKVGMASKYGNLGVLYMTRGNLDHAEEMYEKSVALNEGLGDKEGSASQYGNLGILYSTRGDLDRAEAMYGKSLALFRQVGAAPRIKQVEETLADLRRSD